MKKKDKSRYKLLLIPAASGMAIAAIKALEQEKNISMIAADVDKLASGLYLCDKGYIVPPFKDKSFYNAIYKIIKKEDIDVILPAYDYILMDFSRRKKEIEELGVKLIISEPETVTIARDKWKTYKKLKGKIPLPKSFIKKEDVENLPMIIKPRGGSGSKNVYLIKNKKELDFFYDRVPKPIIQEYLEGKEYSVDCLADKKGKLLACVPQERIDSKAGVATKGKIIKDETLENMAKKISSSIKFFGPFFFQAKEDKEGVPKLTEINPRVAGIMSLASHSGINIHGLAVKMCMGEKITIPKIKHYGLCLTRYFDDIYLKNSDFKKPIT